MALFRLLLRLALMLATLCLLFPVYVIGGLMLAPWPARAYGWRCRMIQRFAGCWCAIMGMRITQVGQAPARPFIMVANHLGYLDILLLLRTVPAWFVSKADVRHWPLIGFLARCGHVMFIDRGRKRDVQRINTQMLDALNRNEAVLFFPEGTSHRGDQIHPFKTSLLAVAAEASLPVHAAVISYQSAKGQPPPSESLCWWGDMTLTPHLLRVLRAPSFHVHLTFLSEPVKHPDRKELATLLRTRMATVFQPNS